MKHPISWTVVPFGALMLASATVSATTVTLQTCSGSSCWDGVYDNVASGATLANAETLENGSGTSVVAWETQNGLQLTDWSITVDSDPLVTNNFAITNTSSSTQTFTIGTTISVLPAIPNGLMRGSIGLSVTDNNNDGATLSTSGQSIYTAFIDGTGARTLWDSPTSFSPSFNGSTISDNINFGFPTRELAPESIDSTIGITITFSLTAGDSASFTSNFDCSGTGRALAVRLRPAWLHHGCSSPEAIIRHHEPEHSASKGGRKAAFLCATS